jgi:hypothetical protein
VNGTVQFRDLYERYNEQVQFLNIYIREAHPVDGWWFGRTLTRKPVEKFSPKVSMEHYDPRTIEERRKVAGECEQALQYGIRTYVDEMDDRVNKAYAAWPTRAYLVGLDGCIAYAGKMGPWNLKPGELSRAIQAHLKQINGIRAV